MITIQDNALLRLRELKEKHKKNYVRLDVKGGGCAGFNYEWSFADEEQRNDAVIDDVLIVVRVIRYYFKKFVNKHLKRFLKWFVHRVLRIK